MQNAGVQVSDKESVPGLIQRGHKQPSPYGTALFVGLRSLDPLLQYQFLRPGGWGSALLSRVGIKTIVPGAAALTGIGVFDRLGLPAPHLILLAMSVGAAAKQSYWKISLCKETFPVPIAITVSVFNTVVNAINGSLLLAAATSSTSAPALPGTSIPYPLVIAPVLYAVGMFLETYSEVQRKTFKDDPKNNGQPIRSGLWTLARHINYGGYAVWRGAYTLASAGAFGGLAAGALWTWNFATQAVPELDAYCTKRYGEQWAAFKQQVPWVVLPGIY